LSKPESAPIGRAASVFASPRRLALALVGLAGLAFIIHTVGWSDVAASFSRIGAGMAAVVLYHAMPLGFDVLGWRALAAVPSPPRLASWYRMRWASESVNNLLPVAQVGGEFVRAHLLGRATGARVESAATVLVDFAMGLVSKVVLAAVGLLLLPGLASPGQDDTIVNLALGILGFAMLVGACILALRLGAFRRIVGPARRMIGWSEDHVVVASAHDLDRAVLAVARNRAKLLRCFAWRVAGWAVAAGELWLICHFLGVAAGLSGLIAVHFLSFVARSAGFILPGAIGIQEGAFVVIGAMIGLAPSDALAMALAVRVREIVFGLPGLGLAFRSRP
jgi:putative membrane protein